MKLIFDFSPEIHLQKKWSLAYRVLQFFVYISFIFFAIFIGYKTFFPVYEFNYVFGATGLSNNIINIRYAKNDSGVENKNEMFFNINQLGEFYDAKIRLIFPDKAIPPKNTSIVLQKSFQAFFYPIGNPIGFKDGSLLFDGEKYYIIADGKYRIFSSLEIAQAFGLTKDSFTDVVSASDIILHHDEGDEISDSRTVINNLIYNIGNTYYQVREGQLWAFTSEKAFLSQYDKKQAIQENESFLDDQIISENAIGYADGTLASIGQSVVILSGGKYYPIDNPITFDGLGYSWDDVIAINQDELSLYARQKQFTDANPHPDGTIFADKVTGQYYMVNKMQKLPIASSAIVNSYLKHKPIFVDSKSLTIQTPSCNLKKDMWPQKSYSCTTSLLELNKLIGNDFQFSVKSDSNNSPASIRVEFSIPTTWKSAKQTLSFVRNSLKYTYTNQQ